MMLSITLDNVFMFDTPIGARNTEEVAFANVQPCPSLIKKLRIRIG